MADLNDLQREWDSQPEYPEEKMNAIAELVRTRSGKMRSVLFARDRAEMGACIFIIVVFGAYWLLNPYWGTAPNAMAKTGIAIIIAGSVEIMVLLQVVRRRGRVDFASAPLKAFLLSEVQMLNRQIALLRHVAWWYLLPLYVGCCLFAIGIGSVDSWKGGRTFAISFCVFYFLLCALIWWGNQKARRKTLEPLRDALQRTYEVLCALDSEQPVASGDLLHILADLELGEVCRRWVRFVRPSWYQIVLMVLACVGGFFAGMLIQKFSGEPMRYEEWPLLGLMVAGSIAFVSTCVRRVGKDEKDG